MENYTINNKTIALLKINNKTIIFYVDKTEVINMNIKKIIDCSCKYYGSNLNGRISSAKTILNDKYRIPIIIDEFNNIILLQMNSPRNNICLYIIANKIINYNLDDIFFKVECINNINFRLKISKNSFEKMLLNALRLNNVLNARKNLKFL